MSGRQEKESQFGVRWVLTCLGSVTAVAALFSALGNGGAPKEAFAQAAVPAASDTAGYPVVRGLYLNRFAAQSGPKLRRLLALADSTEINAFVVDMKDEFGLNYRSANPKVERNAGDGYGRVRFVQALADTLKAHGLMPIARIVAFKDPMAAALNPAWTIRGEDSTIWHDKEGQPWVDAHNREVWEYNLAVAEELAAFGFAEIQFDYMRFPEPYASLPKQVYPGATESKADALAAFLTLARQRLAPFGVRVTADVFGLTASARGTLEVGQNWEKLSSAVDIMLPMVYPSHYPSGAFGVPWPNRDPYTIVKAALDTARTRDDARGLTRAEHVRPWLQAFSLGKPAYGPEELLAQKKAVYDAGYRGWVLWHPGSNYDVFAAALEPRSVRP
jgi:hypothetical protein